MAGIKSRKAAAQAAPAQATETPVAQATVEVPAVAAQVIGLIRNPARGKGSWSVFEFRGEGKATFTYMVPVEHPHAGLDVLPITVGV